MQNNVFKGWPAYGRLWCALAMLALACPVDEASAQACPADELFGDPIVLPTLPRPERVLAFDADRDGKEDLCSIDLEVGSVSVFLSRGDGTFAEPIVSMATDRFGPFDAAAKDFDGDGIIDLAVADSNRGVAVLLGNGDGSFAIAARYLSTASHIDAGDVDGDGRPDIVASNTSGSPDFVTVLFGEGDGTFVVGPQYGVGENPSRVMMEDLNADGALDLAVVGGFDNNVTILLGDGVGSFTEQARYAVPRGPRWGTIADLDGDGDPDLAIPSIFTDTVVTILWNNGDGSFTSRRTLRVDVFQPTGVVAADLDLDGTIDVAASRGGGFSIWRGLGAGEFAEETRYQITGTGFVATFNLNGDSAVDLAFGKTIFSTPPAHQLWVLENLCMLSPCRADLDGDGELTIFDFLAFQNLFDAGDPIADFDGDGSLTIFDFLAFQNAFDAGCP